MRKQANVMLLVLFIMFITSLLGLLVSQYVRSMIDMSRLFTQYYTTYFYAYGGLELGLTQVKYHNFGFEDTATFSGFSNCLYSSCKFEMTIDARSTAIGDASDDYAECADIDADSKMISLASGDCFITPLFYDSSSGFDPESFDTIDDNELITMNPELYSQYSGGVTTGETYTIKVLDEDNANYNVRIEPTVGSPSPYDFAADLSWLSTGAATKNYLIIANATGTTKEFCLQMDTGQFVKNFVTITSLGYNGSHNASFGAVKANQIPPFLCYGTINPSN